MAVANFTLGYTNTPPFYSGTAFTNLVPSQYPVAINGRPYIVDQKSGRFQRGYEQRVRDSQDISTAPGEAAINPGGLWRRGQDSWHLGAGQEYADAAGSVDFRFHKSKGINPWEKGHIRLLNTTKLLGGTNAPSGSTNLFMCTVKSGSDYYLYVADNTTVKWIKSTGANGLFSTSPTWTSVTTATSGSLPTTAITGLETNGTNVFIAFTSNDIWYTTPGSTAATFFYPTGGSSTGKTYYAFGYAKGWGFAAVNNALYVIGVQSGSHTVHWTSGDTTLRFVGAAAGQNAVYVGAYTGTHSIVYRMGWDKTLAGGAGAFEQPVAALELPQGEIVSSIYGYLGFIFVGTNKGVRFCTANNDLSLTAGQIIPTSGPVNDFTAQDRFVWYGYSNYDGTDGGLGRLDLSVFTAPNTPAYATDLMYASTADVKSVTTIPDASGIPRRVFSISGVGVVAEDSASLVASGSIELGIYRWGIPDRKFVAKVDVRSEPLKGSVSAYLSNDNENYASLGVWDTATETEYTYNGSDDKTIEARFKLVLTRSATVTEGPVVTRWMARAYAAPFRSQVFIVPVILHNKIRVKNKDVFLDVQEEIDELDNLIADPRIVVLQIGEKRHSVIVEDVEWTPLDHHGNAWEWEGTATVTMRSVEN